jgi:hypothetical protein
MAVQIQLRRDLSANWVSTNPILADGELGLITDTGTYKIGNGVDVWTSLSSATLSPELTTILLDVQSSDPTPPVSGKMVLYSKAVANRMMPKFIGPSGIDSALQPFLARNKIGYWCPPGNATTAPGVLGYTTQTVVGTATSRIIATTNMYTMLRRIGYVSVATVGGLASLRIAAAQMTTGNGTYGGFLTIKRFGISDAAFVTGARMFIGIASSISAPTNVEPSTLLNCIGVGHGAADTTMHLYHGGSTAQTPIDLGVNFPINTSNTDFYELALHSSPSGSGEIDYEVTRVNTGDVATGTITPAGGVALPGSTTLLSYLWAYRTNNATALSVGLDLMSDYIETDN